MNQQQPQRRYPLGVPSWVDTEQPDPGATAAAVREAGGTVIAAPWDAGPGGRAAICADPLGAVFRIWPARRRLGAQLVNSPGAWNFTNLRADDPSVLGFYSAVFGWEHDAALGEALIRDPQGAELTLSQFTPPE